MSKTQVYKYQKKAKQCTPFMAKHCCPAAGGKKSAVNIDSMVLAVAVGKSAVTYKRHHG